MKARVEVQAIYVCVNARCARYHARQYGMMPSDVRLATGRPAACECGGVFKFVGTTTLKEKST